MLRRVMRNEITVRVFCGDLPRLFDAYIAAGVTLQRVKLLDELHAEFTVLLSNFGVLRKISVKYNAEISFIQKRGIFWWLASMVRRPILTTGIAALVLLSVILPQRILTVSVVGNTQITEGEILEAAERAGIGFGASRRTVRSEAVKNNMLSQLPQLQWVGVNTRGCRATISVKERSGNDTIDADTRCYSIVAARDGVIQSVYVTQGNPLCSVGQAVKAGEMLISAYMDLGIKISSPGAAGEIYAQTLRSVKTVIPSSSEEKGAITGKTCRYSLLIGKKRIKIFKDSGIYDTSCDKMYKEYCLTLPGGIRLPVAIVVEQWRFRENASSAGAIQVSAQTAEKLGETYLLREMIAGEILTATTEVVQGDGYYTVIGIYQCREMIGRLQKEEILTDYGKTD